MRTSLAATLLAVLAFAALPACDGVGGDVLSVRGGEHTTILPPDGQTWFGARVDSLQAAAPEIELETLESEIGRRFDLQDVFVPWAKNLVLEPRPGLTVAAGRIAMISWGGGDSLEIIAGQHDDYIRAVAAGVYALGVPVFLRYGRRMDQATSASWAHAPADFRAAFHRIHDLFYGVAPDLKVAWVYAPSMDAFADGAALADAFDPGDDVVDWNAASGFNWFHCESLDNPVWRELEDVFGPFHMWAGGRGRPIMIAETGTLEDPADPGRKAAWIAAAGAALAGPLADVRAFIYFHGEEGGCPWSAETSAAALTAYTDLAHETIFAP